ncbi:MAG: thymidine phosphorylase, partial [Clostridia bacterium]|nr:thymidine phosphorylase [Clostridia bacterium]
MNIIEIIAKKRDNKELTKEEITFFVKGVTDGSIPDYQTAALLMAIFLNGMTDRETADLTLAMADSGERVDLSSVNGLTVDKHSTGGVGDKTTLIAVPIAAALGAHTAKMSGRALGHTGGTVDKLESIPGFSTAIEPDRFIDIINKTGAAMIGQSKDIAAADKKLYALRDVTSTVESIPLITSSIMSKKIASGSDCIVLDVKCGSGAFMKTSDDAQKLAQAMLRIGKMCGKNITALITNMDIPLGNMVGNTLEVIEAVKVLKGEQKGDLYDLCIE